MTEFDAANRARDAYEAIRPLFKTDRDAYRLEDRILTEQFEIDLAEEYTSDLPENLQKAVYSKAYSDGHSAGFHEIEGVYLELAELVNFAFTAGAKSSTERLAISIG